MSCKININTDGNVEVSAHKGLWNEIKTEYGEQRGLEIFSNVFNEDFEQLGIENPSIQQVLNYVDLKSQSEVGKINKLDKLAMLNLSVNQNMDNFIDIFTLDSGIFGYDLQKLKEVFPPMVANYLYQNTPKEIQDLYYKIKNGEPIDNYNTEYPFVYGNNPLDIENPDLILEDLEQNYAGLTTKEEIENKANEIGDEISDEEIDYILKNLSNMKLVPTFNTTGGLKIINKTSDILLKTFNTRANLTNIKTTTNNLLQLSPVTWIEDSSLVEEVLYELEEQATEAGLDLSGLAELQSIRSPQEYALFLDSLDIFLEQVETQGLVEENVNNFSEIYDEFFDNFSITKQTITSKTPYNEFAVEGRISEQEVFDRFSGIKKEGNVYIKVPKVSLSDIENRIFDTLPPQNDITKLKVEDYNREEIIKDIDNMLSKRASLKTNPNSNFDTLKQIEGLKYIYNVGDSTDIVNFPERDIDLVNYEIELYQELLEKPHLFEHIGFSSQGIELLTKGEYTSKLLSIELDNFRKLQDYAVISSNPSLESLIDQPETPNKRTMYVNNPHTLERFKMSYKKPTDTTVVTSYDSAEFINIDNEIYEKVQPNVYEKVAPFSVNFQYNLKRPTVKIDNPMDYLVKPEIDKNVNKGKLEEISCNG